MRVNLIQWSRTHTLYLYSHLPAPAGAITPQGKETHVEGTATLDTAIIGEPLDSYDVTVKLYLALYEADKITDETEAYAYFANPQAYRPAMEKLVDLGGFSIVPFGENDEEGDAWAGFREWTRTFEPAIAAAGAAS